MTSEPRPTRYVFDVSCADLGEYDAVFVAAVASATCELLGAAGVHDFHITTTRRRPGEFS